MQSTGSPNKPEMLLNLSDGNSNHYKRLFFATVALITALLVFLSQGAGINGDEKYHTYITNNILDFYTSLGKDTSLFIGKKKALALIKEQGEQGAEEMGVEVDDLPMSNDLMYYGGFFEIICAIVTKSLGYDDDSQLGFHNLRHLLIAIFGALTILFAGLTAKEILNWRCAVFAAVILFATPRFTGHSLMNPKDIPFAFGYILSLYFMIRFLKQLPAPSWRTVAGLITGIAISINIRIGGILLLAYLLMFLPLFWYYYSFVQKAPSFNTAALPRLGLKIAAVIILSYFLGLVFWPYGLIDPLGNPIDALSRFSKYPARINQLFEGEQIRSNKLPWYYLPKYLLISNPFILLTGAGLFVILCWMKTKLNKGLAAVVLFLCTFPVLFIIIRESTVYSGARHILFIIPPLAVLSASGWECALHVMKSPAGKTVIAVFMTALLINPFNWIFAHHPYQYAYFSPSVGGLKEAYKYYTSDYWMISMKEACEWLVENVPKDKRIIVGTNGIYPTEIYLNNLSDSFEVKYVKYYLKSDSDWDYGIFYVDYVNPHQLQNGLYPPDKTVYTVKAQGAPMCVVVKRVDKSDYLGFQALDHKKFEDAISYFQQAIKIYPNNEAPYMGLGAAYLFNRQPESALKPLQHSLQLMPKQGLTNYYLGLTHAQLGNEDMAIAYVNRSIKINPRIRQSYQLLGKIYESRGDTLTAKKYFDFAERVAKLKKN